MEINNNMGVLMKIQKIFITLFVFSSSISFAFRDEKNVVIIKKSNVTLLSDITSEDTPKTIKIKMEFEKIVLDLIGDTSGISTTTDKQSELINLAIVNYKGKANIKEISNYVKKLKQDKVVKYFVLISLVQGMRESSFKTNKNPDGSFTYILSNPPQKDLVIIY